MITKAQMLYTPLALIAAGCALVAWSLSGCSEMPPPPGAPNAHIAVYEDQYARCYLRDKPEAMSCIPKPSTPQPARTK